MPELPEVETTLRGITPSLEGQVIGEIVVRNPSLRWPVPEEVFQGMGVLAAEFLDEFVQPEMVLGVSYGRSVAAMIDRLTASPLTATRPGDRIAMVKA